MLEIGNLLAKGALASTIRSGKHAHSVCFLTGNQAAFLPTYPVELFAGIACCCPSLSGLAFILSLLSFACMNRVMGQVL
ncbi:hypothetical protein [Alteromonas antoniana]|uniref:hypothetical protein n=1 Tax=Alteromonas antoniana TaxID=2803813 RepID=UPI001C488A8C|nr:hypothetical protein [Alteromonas antoniana]